MQGMRHKAMYISQGTDYQWCLTSKRGKRGGVTNLHKTLKRTMVGWSPDDGWMESGRWLDGVRMGSCRRRWSPDDGCAGCWVMPIPSAAFASGVCFRRLLPAFASGVCFRYLLSGVCFRPYAQWLCRIGFVIGVKSSAWLDVKRLIMAYDALTLSKEKT